MDWMENQPSQLVAGVLEGVHALGSLRRCLGAHSQGHCTIDRQKMRDEERKKERKKVGGVGGGGGQQSTIS